ncbi:autotransporter assembly complex family protein [Hydrogenophaga sp.]|uniref:autotransporter assembly complex protein TamA n=1 Tax=Hydrogenophaga sp. TaxID=1904254 RepID=UPI003562E624
MNPFVLHRAQWARWSLLACALLPAALALAQPRPAAEAASAATTPPASPAASTPTPVDDADPAAASSPRFNIELQTEPKELREFLLRHMELQRFRQLADLDANELNRLLEKAPDNLGDLLGTLGHFNPEVELLGLSPDAQSPLGTVRLRVDPGPLTRVEHVIVAFRGDIADRPETAAQRADIQAAFTLQVGDRFTQADWDSAKSAALRQLTALRYPAGRIDGSLADINPVTHSARLAVEFDSGAPVRIGDVRVQGAERYDEATANNLVRLSGLVPGSDYNLAHLQEAQQRIAETGYYDSVFVYVEPGADSQVAPVVVQVRESLRQKLVLGIGASTDSGPRLSVEHTNHRMLGSRWRAVSKLLIERDDQLLSTDWSRPVDTQGWRWITGAQTARQIDGYDTTTSQRLRLGQSQDTTNLDRSFFLQYDRALSENSLDATLGTGVGESALSANYAWTRRRFDNLLQPNSGHGLGVELGVGSTLVPIRRPFFRTRLRWLGYWPIASDQPYDAQTTAAALGEAKPAAATTSNAGRLALRLEVGAVWAQKDAPIPETQLFLTGGDNSVRGYGLRDIGLPQADGGVSPGRYLAVAILEWQRPLYRNGVRTPFESVLFVDAGAVADQPGELRPRLGVGTGLRYNSPVGPLQVDLAYGLKSKRLRLHLNVGFTF